MAHIYSQFLYLYLTYTGHWATLYLTVSDVLFVFVFLTFMYQHYGSISCLQLCLQSLKAPTE